MPFPNIPLASSVDVPVTQGVPSLLGNSVTNSIDGMVSGFAGQAIDAWSIQWAAKKWGIYDPTLETVHDKDGNPVYEANEADSETLNEGGAIDIVNLKPMQRAKGAVLTAAHVYSVDITESYSLSNAPQEDGAFMTYNKVKNPFTGTIRMICDGTETGDGILGQVFHLPSFLRDKSKTPTGIRQDFMDALEGIVADTKLYTILTPDQKWNRANIIGYRINRATHSGATMLVVDITFQEVRNTRATGWTNTATPSGQQAIHNGTVQLSDTDGNEPVVLGQVY